MCVHVHKFVIVIVIESDAKYLPLAKTQTKSHFGIFQNPQIKNPRKYGNTPKLAQNKPKKNFTNMRLCCFANQRKSNKIIVALRWY